VFPVGADQVQIIGWDANGVLIGDMCEFGYFLVAQAEFVSEFLW
jgi:hypothetical protein